MTSMQLVIRISFFDGVLQILAIVWYWYAGTHRAEGSPLILLVFIVGTSFAILRSRKKLQDCLPILFPSSRVREIALKFIIVSCAWWWITRFLFSEPADGEVPTLRHWTWDVHSLLELYEGLIYFSPSVRKPDQAWLVLSYACGSLRWCAWPIVWLYGSERRDHHFSNYGEYSSQYGCQHGSEKSIYWASSNDRTSPTRPTWKGITSSRLSTGLFVCMLV